MVEEKISNLPFKDVNDKQEYAKYIQTLYTNKITTGTSTTTFDPNKNVTRGQFVSFIHRTEKNKLSKNITIQDIKNNELKLSTGTYPITAELKKVLNESNLPVLKGATIKLIEKNNQIVGITSIELKANGTASKNLTLDGDGITFPGNLLVSGDYITIKNLTITGDLQIGSAVKNSFVTDRITVLGKTIISDSAVVAKANTVNIAAITTPKTKFHNTTLGTVELSKSGATFEVTGTSTVKSLQT